MTNPAPHQPAPENVSKEAIDEIRTWDAAEWSIKGAPAIERILREQRRDLLAKIDELQRLNAQKDAQLIELRSAAMESFGITERYVEDYKARRDWTMPIRLIDVLAKTADSYAGKVVLEAEAVDKMRSALLRVTGSLGLIIKGARADAIGHKANYELALALLDAPTANPENGKDGK